MTKSSPAAIASSAIAAWVFLAVGIGRVHVEIADQFVHGLSSSRMHDGAMLPCSAANSNRYVTASVANFLALTAADGQRAARGC
jgi:hypothetical protein